jgi:hypothetical protein
MGPNRLRVALEQTPFAGGMSFGLVGPYECLRGKIHFAIDPSESGLPWICDLELAPRNAEGLVEFSASLDIVKPVDLSRGNGRVLYEFANRGRRDVITRLNYGRGRDMTRPEHAGDGFLMRQGFTIVWSGWQGDLIDRGTNVRASLPEALENGRRLRGRVRQEFSVIQPGVLSMGVSEGAEGGENVEPYPVLDKSTATLTMREHEQDLRVLLPPHRLGTCASRIRRG